MRINQRHDIMSSLFLFPIGAPATGEPEPKQMRQLAVRLK